MFEIGQIVESTRANFGFVVDKKYILDIKNTIICVKWLNGYYQDDEPQSYYEDTLYKMGVREIE